jgi:hypothetical protein
MPLIAVSISDYTVLGWKVAEFNSRCLLTIQDPTKLELVEM